MILCSEAANKQLCELRLYLSFIFSLSSSTTLSLMEPFHGHLHIFKSLLSSKIKIKTENLPWSHFLLQLPLYFLLPLSSLELPVHTPCFHASHFMHPSCLQGFSILIPWLHGGDSEVPEDLQGVKPIPQLMRHDEPKLLPKVTLFPAFVVFLLSLPLALDLSFSESFTAGLSSLPSH